VEYRRFDLPSATVLELDQAMRDMERWTAEEQIREAERAEATKKPKSAQDALHSSLQ
jgi:hypothetical protein